MNEPTNVMTRNVGNGELEVQWDPPSIGTPVYYNVYVSRESAGTYQKANKKNILNTCCKIPNLRFGIMIFTKVCAVDSDGVEGPLSAVAVDGICPPKVLTMLQITGPVGDIIPVNAVFCANANDEVVGFRILETTEL